MFFFSAICMWNSFRKNLSLFHMNLFHHFQFTTSRNFTSSPISNFTNLNGGVLGRLSQCLAAQPVGNPWGPVPQAAHGANGQRLKELHSNGCIFSSLASLAQKKNDQLSREISGRWSVFSQKIVDFVFGNLYWYVWKDSQRVWDPHMELHFKLKRALVYSSFIQSRVGWCLAIR